MIARQTYKYRYCGMKIYTQRWAYNRKIIEKGKETNRRETAEARGRWEVVAGYVENLEIIFLEV